MQPQTYKAMDSKKTVYWLGAAGVVLIVFFASSLGLYPTIPTGLRLFLKISLWAIAIFFAGALFYEPSRRWFDAKWGQSARFRNCARIIIFFVFPILSGWAVDELDISTIATSGFSNTPLFPWVLLETLGVLTLLVFIQVWRQEDGVFGKLKAAEALTQYVDDNARIMRYVDNVVGIKSDRLRTLLVDLEDNKVPAIDTCSYCKKFFLPDEQISQMLVALHKGRL